MCSLKIFGEQVWNYLDYWNMGGKKKKIYFWIEEWKRGKGNNVCIQETRSSLELFLLLERFRIVQYYPVPYENEEVLKSENPSSLGHWKILRNPYCLNYFIKYCMISCLVKMYRFYREIKCVTKRNSISELFHRPFFFYKKKKGSEIAIYRFISSCNCK